MMTGLKYKLVDSPLALAYERKLGMCAEHRHVCDG